MVDEILACEVLLGHRAVHIVLVSDVAVEIDLGRHDRLARQVDTRRAGRDLQIAPPADTCEPVILHDECGVLDRGAAIARNQPGPFEHRHARRAGLSVHAPGGGHRREATGNDEETKRNPFFSTHWSTSGETIGGRGGPSLQRKHAAACTTISRFCNAHSRKAAMPRACWTVVLTTMLWTIGLAAAWVEAQAPLHESQYADADIAYGATLYASKCVTCHGTQGDAIGGVNLRSGTFRNAVIDRDLERFIRAGSPAGMPPFALDNSEMAGIIAYLRNMNAFDTAAVKMGDAARGRAIFLGKGACTSCHRVGVTGSRVAPNLSDIGTARSAGSLQRSLVDPNSQMMPINRPVRVVTKDGTIINGRRLNEDTYRLQIIDDHERLLSLVKADLREYTISKTSLMPSYKGTLSDEEIADLLAYLLSLKGQLP
jgi:putative heme-binding domain-containing protein